MVKAFVATPLMLPCVSWLKVIQAPAAFLDICHIMHTYYSCHLLLFPWNCLLCSSLCLSDWKRHLSQIPLWPLLLLQWVFHLFLEETCGVLGCSVTWPSATSWDPMGWLEEPTGWLEEPTGWLEEPTGWLEEPTGWLEEPTGWLEEPTGWLEEPTGWLEEPMGWLEEPMGWLEEPMGSQVDVRDGDDDEREEGQDSGWSRPSLILSTSFTMLWIPSPAASKETSRWGPPPRWSLESAFSFLISSRRPLFSTNNSILFSCHFSVSFLASSSCDLNSLISSSQATRASCMLWRVGNPLVGRGTLAASPFCSSGRGVTCPLVAMVMYLSASVYRGKKT